MALTRERFKQKLYLYSWQKLLWRLKTPSFQFNFHCVFPVYGDDDFLNLVSHLPLFILLFVCGWRPIHCLWKARIIIKTPCGKGSIEVTIMKIIIKKRITVPINSEEVHIKIKDTFNTKTGIKGENEDTNERSLLFFYVINIRVKKLPKHVNEKAAAYRQWKSHYLLSSWCCESCLNGTCIL